MSLEDKHDASVLNWADKDFKVMVEQPHEGGFWCTLKLIARIKLSPSQVFTILTDPTTHKRGVFRSVKGVNYREVLEDDGHGRQKVETEQVARWKLGPFKGTFNIRLIVTQDKRNHTIHFDLAHPYGFMKSFAGTWTIRPFRQDDIDELVNYPDKHWGPMHGLAKALHSFEDHIVGKHNDISLVQLEQSVQPSLVPPAPLDRVLKKIAAAQIRCIMEDLQKEVERVSAQREIEDGKHHHSSDSVKQNKLELTAHIHKLEK